MNDWQAYLVMSQIYEQEFSPWTYSIPDANGMFSESTPLGIDTFGYICKIGDTPFGFAIITQHASDLHEVKEFFIHPNYRLQGYGCAFFFALARKYPGNWVIKEIESASWAREFWCRILTPFDYNETIVHNDKWGRVYQQSFHAGPSLDTPPTGVTKPTARLKVM